MHMYFRSKGKTLERGLRLVRRLMKCLHSTLSHYCFFFSYSTVLLALGMGYELNVSAFCLIQEHVGGQLSITTHQANVLEHPSQRFPGL